MQRTSHYQMWHKMSDYPRYLCALMRGPVNRTANRRTMQENLLALASVVPDGAFVYGANPYRDFAPLWESRYSGYGSRIVVNGIPYRAYLPQDIRSTDTSNAPISTFDAIFRAAEDVLLPNTAHTTSAGAVRTELLLNKVYSHVLFVAPRVGLSAVWKSPTLTDAYTAAATNLGNATIRMDAVRRILWTQSSPAGVSQWGATVYVPESEIEPYVPDPVTHMYMVPLSTWYFAPPDAMIMDSDFVGFILDSGEFSVQQPDGSGNFPNLSRIRVRFK